MSATVRLSRGRLALPFAFVVVLFLSGCASVSLEQNLARTNDEAASFTDGKLSLARDPAAHALRHQSATALLAAPLGQKEAVQLALVNSPALQALVAQNWAGAALAAQSGRIANPVFSFERLRLGDELELGRLLSFGLLDLLTLPQRKDLADQRIEQARLRLSAEVIDQVTQLRQAWVHAVAAQQSLAYAQQVYRSAAAGAELARRMAAAGNFNKIARARQQAFYADAATRLAGARQQMTATRETLVRLLGLDDAQARELKLPDLLPELPEQPLQPERIAQMASRGRLDIRLEQSALNAALRAEGLDTIASFTDIELGVRRNTVFDGATRTTGRGYEIDVRLPIFDWGGMRRDALGAQTLAAANRLEATVRAAGSNLRENYAAYRTAYDIARHYRDEVVPLRKIISEENMLRYNGMLIGVFELLADSRDQIAAVLSSIGAAQQFWLADAALQASVVGRPMHSASANPAPVQPAAGGPGH